MKRSLRLALVLLILVVTTACDQYTKAAAKERLKPFPDIVLLDGSLRLGYTENRGAILGLGAGLPENVRSLLFIALNSAVLALGLAYLTLARQVTPWQVAAGALILSGGVGNLIDRLFHGGWVVDFIQLGLGPLKTGIFNLADVAILVGVFALLGMLWRERSRA